MNAAKPAFTWADLTQQPEFQSADQTQREDMQLRYFQQVVAPSIPQSQYRELRDAFFESTLPDVEVKQPGLLRRSMDAIGGAVGGVRERLTPETPTYDEGAWQEVERSEAFLQGDTRARHDLRQQFFRDNVAGDLEGEARRQAERDFYAGTDIRGTVEGSDWRPDREGERRGLQTWESGSTGRPPVEGASSTSGTVEEAVGLVRSGAAGAVGAVGAATEGWGAIIQQADNVEANRSVADAEKRLLTTQRNMDEALAATTDEYRDQVAANYQRDLERRESELFEAMNKWAEREPNDAAAWLMKRGLDLREFAEQVDVDPESRTFLNDVAGGVGSMLTYLGPGMVASALTRGSMAAGMGVSLGMAAPSGVSEAYTRAIAAGLSEEEALERSIAGAVPGAIQVAPLASLIKGVPPHMRGKALGELYGILRTGAQEGVVEGLGQIGQNFIERFYNEDRGLTEGAGRAAAVGAVSGGVTHGLTTSSREFGLGDQGRLGQAMQAEADSLQFVDDADALARQALDPEGAQMRQIEPGTPEWEAQWRAHEQQHGLDPIDLQQDTGVSATVSPGAPEAGGMEVGGLIDGGMRQDTPAQAAQAEDAQLADLLRTPATEDAPEIARAQQSLAMGDGFAFLWERAGGDQGAQEALNRMQEAYLQGDGDGAATAYQEAMQTIRANERRGAQQERKQAAIEQAREQVAAEGGDALSQTIAGEQAEAQANALSEQENAADPIFRPAPPTSPLAGQTMPVGPGSVVDQQTAVGEPQAQPLEADADPGAMTPVRVPVEAIQVDPDAYQFRTEVNERGVDDRMEGIQRWDDLRAGELVLHERTDGSLFVADGHHRLDLARRLEQPGVNAFVLREADGYSVEDARRLAAERNIASGSSTAIDAAKVFRNTEGDPSQVIVERDLPRRSQVVRDGADIARLGDEAFGAVLNGVVTEKDGAAIGRAFDDADQQLAAIDVFQRIQPQNDNQRALLVNEIRQAGFAESQGEQGGLFGDDPAQSLIGERVRVMDRLRQDLVRDRRLFATLNRNARTAEQAGNVIATEANESLSDSAARAVALLERVSTNPEMNARVNEAARRVNEGQSVAEAVAELKEALLRGPESEAAQQPVAPDAGRGQAEGRGQVERGDRRAPAQDDARAEAAGEQRLVGEPAAAPAAELTYKADGSLFASESSAMRSGVARRAQAAGTPVRAVPVDGGFAVRVEPVLDRSQVTQDQADGAQDVEIGTNNRGDTVLENPVTGLRTFRTRQGGGNSELGRSNRNNVYVASQADVRNRRPDYITVEERRGEDVRPAPAAQPDVDAADTTAQRVEETPIDRQEGADPVLDGEGQADPRAPVSEIGDDGLIPAERAQVAQEADELAQWMRETAADFNDSYQSVDLAPVATDLAEHAITTARRMTEAEITALSERYGVPEWIVEDMSRQPFAIEGLIDRRDTAGRELRRRAREQEADTLTLETQTEESLAAREQETQAAEQAEAEQRRRESERAQADRDADDFLLTGSDTAADQAMARGQDSLFRLEPPSDVAARRDAIAEAIGQHPELAGVQPVARVGELPATVQITMLAQGIDPRSVRGVFVGGELYVVAENVADTADGVKVAVHEAVGHHGVREVLGDRLAPEMRRLYATFPHSHETFQLVRERYPHLDTSTREGQQEFAEELVAHLAETNPQVNAWQRFVARVRDLLRQVFPEVAWTENDVRALIQRSRETLAEQALVDGTVVAGSPRFAIAPPTDSQAFREWFGESKAVEADGSPMVVYHGSFQQLTEITPGYDEPGAWFAEDRRIAANYTGTEGVIHEVYLKAENPLEVRFDDDGGELFAIIDGEPSEIDSNIGLVRYAEQQGYDSVYFPDGNFSEDSAAWVVFDASQAKSATDNRGTFDPNNPDIRFSLSEAPQQPRLSAIHNISADGLAYADQMGGLAVPSIGVVTEGAGGVDGFGEITLIGRRGLADPAQEAVFSADAYTVRFPRPEFEGYSEADYRRLREQLEPFVERFGDPGALSMLREHGKDSPDAGELVTRALGRSPVMAMYLDSQGVRAEPVMRPTASDQDAALLQHPALSEWRDADVLVDAYVAAMDGDNGPIQRLTAAVREAFVETQAEQQSRALAEMMFDSGWVDGDGILEDGIFSRITNAAEAMGRAPSQDVDAAATRESLRDQIADEPAFKQWVEETFVTPMGEPRIKVGRRKLPYTLDNIVDAMTRGAAIAGREETMTFGAGQVRAANAEQFQTLERMREAAAEQIRNPAEYEAAEAETEALLDRYRTKVSGHTTLQDYRGNPDIWEGLDGAMRAVARYLGYQRRGRAAFERALKAEKFDVAAIREEIGSDAAVMRAQRQITSLEQDLAKWQDRQQKLPADDARQEQIAAQIARFEQRIAEARAEAEGEVDIIALGMQAAEALETAPVPYFEAKPQRAVALDEFAGAVIPEGAPQSVREILDRHGLPYREAPAEQRAQAVHDFRAELDQGGEDVLFSLGDQADRPTATQVRDSLQGVEGLGRPEVLDSHNQLDLDTGLRLTLRGIDPQSVVAFHDDAGRLRVIAGNAESSRAAVEAAVLERVKRNGLGSVLGDRLDTIGKNAYAAMPGNTAARQELRTVRAEYDYLNPSLPGDRTVLALEVINRLQERGNAPTFATEAMEQVRSLLGERYGISDAGNLARANRAYLDRMQRDYGRKRPPAPPAFQLDLQDSGGTGTLLDLNPQVIDGDGNVISDARVASFWTFNPFQQMGNFVFSQSDRLRATGSRPLVELGNRIDRYFDQADRRLGVVNAILRDPLKAMQQGMPGKRRERQRLFEQYWRDWDNGRRESAQAVYDANPTVAAMVDAAVEMFHQTGLENQSVKTPTRTGMWVFDGKGYRKIGKIRRGEFWPRALRREVQAVLQDPSADPVLWRELVDALVDGGHAKDRQEAGTMLMDRSRGYFSEQVTRDYFAGIEKARGEKLPEIFYDYSLDVVADYASKWSMRISQAEQFGQKLRPNDRDAFDEAMGMAADKRTEKFIGQVRDNIYGAQNIGMYGEFMGNANVLATGLHLGNWATASQNLTTGSALNVQMFGARRVAKAYAELVRDWDTIYREGVAEGILGKDVMNLIRDTDSHHDANVFSPDSQSGRFHKLMQRFNAGNMSGREMIREFSRLAMKYGGYNATEQMIRANAFVAAKAQLADALHAWNQKPSSLDAKKYRRFMGHNRIDVDALIRENGKGEETSKYLRLMVNLPQGSYRADQAPLYVDTQIGRFFFKYQKFGTQVSRLFWQQRIKPFVDLVQDSNATAAERAGAFLDIVHYVGTGAAAGFFNRKTRSILFGMAFVGADWDEIIDRFNDEDWGLTLAWLTDMLYHSAMSAGSIFGFFGSPMQSVIDFRDGQRVKNPMEPPGFAVFQGIQGLGVKFWQQGGYLSVPDVRDAVLREVSLPRVADRTAQSALNAIGADLDRTRLEMNRRDVGYIRGAARRWADIEGIEARASGSFSPGSTENTPANNRIHDAVRIGDQARARQLILGELNALSGDERRSRLRSIKATLRARHPLRLAGNTMNAEQQQAFKRWAQQNLPASRWETIQEVTNTYDRTLESALWRVE